MKYACPVVPALKNANTEIQMICIRTPTVWQRAVKLLADCIRKQIKHLQEYVVCHRPLQLKLTSAVEGLIMHVCKVPNICHLCGCFPIKHCFVSMFYLHFN